MKQKINLRLAIIALVAVIATTIGITLVYYNLFQMQVREDLQINAQLLSDSGMFQNIYEEADGEANRIDVSALANMRSDNLRITWVASDGIVLYDNDTDASEMQNHLDRPEIQEAIENGEGECVRKSETMNFNTFYYALKLNDGTILRVSMQARSISNVFFMAAPVILIISAIIVGLCILLGHFLTMQLLRPLNIMAEHMDDNMEYPIYRELEPFADKIRIQHENILAAASSRVDFTANISHELKTPLTAISGYAELIENHMVGPEQETHIAEQIRHNAEQLITLINDIIKLSELDHTELPHHLETMDLYETAAECCQELQVNAAQKKVTLTCFGAPVKISGERNLIKEMVINLAQNAIQYNKEGGYVHVMAFAENGNAVLTVEDTGIGIPKNQQDRIFERFYRVDKSRSRETGGTGLGLAIVKHIAEIHNAEITVDSKQGKGTKITVIF